jgi:hypothetical protein
MVITFNSFSHIGRTSAYMLEVIVLEKKRVYLGKEILISFRGLCGRLDWFHWDTKYVPSQFREAFLFFSRRNWFAG